MQTKQPIDAELPEGVELRDYDDYKTLRGQIFNNVKTAFEESFPASYGGVRVELDNVRYEGPEDYNLKDQKEAILYDKFLTRRLRGTMRMFDEETGDQVDETDISLARVPWLTQRNTFIHGGNEYSSIMQSRLLPGVYTRRQANGHLETQFNVRPGTGKGFRVGFEPDTAQYRLRISQANLHLYSLLKDMGTSDEDLKKRWGEDIWAANAAKYDSRVFDKAYQRLVPNKLRKPDATPQEKAEAIKNAMDAASINRYVVAKNLPGMLGTKQASEQRAVWAGRQAVKEAAERAIDAIPFAPDYTPDECIQSAWTFEFEKRAAIEALPTMLKAKEYSDNKQYNRKAELMLLLMQARPDEFIVDQDDDKFPGITHTPTGFRMHVPKAIIPKSVSAVYREGGTFTHEGKEYDLDTHLAQADNIATEDLPVDKLVWVLEHDTPDPVRTEKADVTKPILVSSTSDGRLAVVDGLHRLARTIQLGGNTIPAKQIQVKQASEDFTPDLSPDDMRESYNSIYGHAGPQLASMKEWPAEWLDDTHPQGWLQWFEQYHAGARGDTDEKQIKRWKSFKARHGSQLIKNPTPRRAYALRNWGIDPLKLIDDEQKRKELEVEMEKYKARAEEEWRQKHANFDSRELTIIADFLNQEHDAKIPIGTVSTAQMEQHILDFVSNNMDGLNTTLLQAGVDGLESVRKATGTTSTGLPKDMLEPIEPMDIS